MAVSKGSIVHNEWDFALQGLVRSSVVRELPRIHRVEILQQVGSILSLTKIPCNLTRDVIPRVEPKLTQFADLLDSGGDTRVPGSTFRRRIPNGGAETTRSIVGSGSFTQPVVRSGDVVHQPAVSPRRIPFPAAESPLAPVSPSPRRPRGTKL